MYRNVQLKANARYIFFSCRCFCIHSASYEYKKKLHNLSQWEYQTCSLTTRNILLMRNFHIFIISTSEYSFLGSTQTLAPKRDLHERVCGKGITTISRAELSFVDFSDTSAIGSGKDSWRKSNNHISKIHSIESNVLYMLNKFLFEETWIMIGISVQWAKTSALYFVRLMRMSSLFCK
jgi:hypothetical protein